MNEHNIVDNLRKFTEMAHNDRNTEYNQKIINIYEQISRKLNNDTSLKTKMEEKAKLGMDHYCFPMFNLNLNETHWVSSKERSAFFLNENERYALSSLLHRKYDPMYVNVNRFSTCISWRKPPTISLSDPR